MRKAALIIVAFLLVVIAISGASRSFITSSVEFTESGIDNNKLFVYLPGMEAGGVESSDVFSAILAEKGRLVQVSYNGSCFRPGQIVQEVADWLDAYRGNSSRHLDIVFVGSSLGGLLAYDIRAELMSRGWSNVSSRQTFQFVIIDSPVGSSDLKSPNNWESWIVGPFGSFIGAPFNWIKDSKGYALSYLVDQVHYLGGHKALREGSLSKDQVIFVKSTEDKLVSDKAIKSWNVTNPNMKVIRVKSPHAGFNDRPAVWKSTFENRILPLLN